MFLIIILYALLAGTFSLGKLLLAYTQPIFLVGIRMSISGVILLGYYIIRKKALPAINRKHCALFVQATLFTIYIPYLLRYWGLVYLSSSKACLLYNFGPFVSYFFSYLLCKEQVTVKKIAGLSIGFIGILPLVISSPSQAATTHSLFLLPEIAILIAVSSMSYGWVIIHRLLNHYHYQASMTNGIIMLSGGLLALLTSFLCEDPAHYIIETMPFIGLLTVIIIVSNLICHNLYGALLRKHTPTMLSFTSFLSPIFAAIYGWLFMDETIAFRYYFSSTVIALGLALFYADELRHNTEIQTSVQDKQTA